MTTARAIETRCCSPPESSSGREPGLVREPDEREHLRHLLADRRRRLALDPERVRDVLERRAVAEQLEVLEDAADVAAQQRHLRALEPRQVAPADDDAPARRLELLEEEPDDRRLARAGRADDEDELALLDHERRAIERDDVRVVDLADVLEHDHRRRGLAALAVRRATSGSSRSAADGVEVDVRRSSMHRARGFDAASLPGRSGSGFAPSVAESCRSTYGLAGGPGEEVGLDEAVEVAVEHALGVARPRSPCGGP